MYRYITLTFLYCVQLFAIKVSSAQGTLADYERAEAADTLFRNKIYNNPSSFYWLKGSQACWYLNTSQTGKAFMFVDVQKKKQQAAFDHNRLAKSLSQKIGKMIQAKALPFEKINFADDQQSIEFLIDSARWRCNLSTYNCEVVAVERKEGNSPYWGTDFDETAHKPVPSADSIWMAFIRNHNVYIRNRKTREEHQLSFDGAAGDFYSTYIQWSPDSKKLMAYKVRPGEKHVIYFVESAPKDQLQPKLCSRDYLKPGDALAQRSPQLFLVDERKHVPVRDDLFRNQFSLSDIAWRKDSRSFTLEYNARGHQQYKVLEVAVPTGEVRTLIDEQSDTFIDYSSKIFRHDVADGKTIIWASERDGWNHLYLFDGVTGKLKNQITKGSWIVRRVMHVDEEKRQVIFSASGMDEGQDPYLTHYCKINFDGTGFVRLTNDSTSHNATFSPDYKYFVDQYSRVDKPSVTVLRSAADGKEIMRLQEADIKALVRTGWKTPEVFSAKGRDGKTDIWGIIIKPTNFDPNKKYPVIEYIYAGPHSSFVPKTFYAGYRGLHTLAELGFIVVQMDGMGTSNRSKAFHDVCWKNLKDAGFPDRIAWIRAAAAKYNYMDISSVGIFGNSAGGQSSAGALLFHPDFYKVAVSSSGCHDNRMDKIWWNEQWMGYPVGSHYAESSNVVNAHKLKGELMLILGELDDNVDPATTMQFVNALVKADKNFELVFIPGMGHSMGGAYGERKRRDFFVRHLLGVEPPAWRAPQISRKN